MQSGRTSAYEWKVARSTPFGATELLPTSVCRALAGIRNSSMGTP